DRNRSDVSAEAHLPPRRIMQLVRPDPRPDPQPSGTVKRAGSRGSLGKRSKRMTDLSYPRLGDVRSAPRGIAFARAINALVLAKREWVSARRPQRRGAAWASQRPSLARPPLRSPHAPPREDTHLHTRLPHHDGLRLVDFYSGLLLHRLARR